LQWANAKETHRDNYLNLLSGTSKKAIVKHEILSLNAAYVTLKRIYFFKSGNHFWSFFPYFLFFLRAHAVSTQKELEKQCSRQVYPKRIVIKMNLHMYSQNATER